MTSQINPRDLLNWCQIPIESLEDHPPAKGKLKIFPEPDDLYRWIARKMVDQVQADRAAGKPTRWILPCGPTRQYAYFTRLVNHEKISLRDVHVFHMDDFLDWQGRPLPLDHPLSYQGWMLKNFYAPIDPELAIPPEQRHFPSVYHIDAIGEAIQALGGIDTTYGGVGYHGHIAYNEPPRSPWYTVTEEAFRSSRTRILHLNEDTLIALSQRVAGGCSHAIPPMAITLGMADLLSARRVRLFSDTGAWKRTVIRVLLFGPTTTEYPATFVQDHPDAMILVDRNTAAQPLEGWSPDAIAS
jgi:glucosamine-6-phosphate deaminase